MSAWNYGCGEKMPYWTRRGREIKVSCGSTNEYGGVHQCEKCSVKIAQPPAPYEDEGDLEWDHRVNGMEDA